MARFDARLVAAVALLALLPVAYYMVGTAQNRVALSLLSMVIVAASLFLMMGPSEPTAAAE